MSLIPHTEMFAMLALAGVQAGITGALLKRHLGWTSPWLIVAVGFVCIIVAVYEMALLHTIVRWLRERKKR